MPSRFFPRRINLNKDDFDRDLHEVISQTVSPASDDKYFGRGTDGDARITGSYRLNRDAHFSNLTLAPNARLTTGNYRLWVKNQLVMNPGSSIQSYTFSPGFNPTGLPSSTHNPNGRPRVENEAAVFPYQRGEMGYDGSDARPTYPKNGIALQILGGAGGNGGRGGAGRYGEPLDVIDPRGGLKVNWRLRDYLRIFFKSPKDMIAGGWGLGGYGGARGYTVGSVGGGGGNGGLSGGICWVAARFIKFVFDSNDLTGAFVARGSNGGSGYVGSASDAGAGGGGGGGGGGIVVIHFLETNIYDAPSTGQIVYPGGLGGGGAEIGRGGNHGAWSLNCLATNTRIYDDMREHQPQIYPTYLALDNFPTMNEFANGTYLGPQPLIDNTNPSYLKFYNPS